MGDDVWAGQWVCDRLGIQFGCDPPELRERLVGLALRRRSSRPYLLVSQLLGKHVPLDPRTVHRTGTRLGELAQEAVGGLEPVVFGYAETATALGHAVADRLGANYLHSTRRAVPGTSPVFTFTESHSHATEHLVLAEDARMLVGPEVVVLVDDELSTGNTARNTIRELHGLSARKRYVIATLLDSRNAEDVAAMQAYARTLGAEILIAGAARGALQLPHDLPERAARLLESLPPAAATRPGPRGELERVDPGWPDGLRESGRHGYASCRAQRPAQAAARAAAARLGSHVAGDRVLVLGTEELMHTPMLIAAAFADCAPEGRSVEFSSTTRSPVVALDEPGYPVRTALSFPAHEPGATGERYAYNVAPAAGVDAYTDIVLVVDAAADTPRLWAPDGLAEQLRGVCERVLVLTLPTYTPAP